MSGESEEPAVPIVCDACGTESEVPLSDLVESLAAHNERFHEGREEAVLDPALAEEIERLAAADILEEE